MSAFAVKVVPITIEAHPNADALELARVADYRAVVAKGQFKTGELAAYIPEGAVLPAALIEEMGLTGKLAGSKHNRVKAIRLRGSLSQGICFKARPEWVVGQDVTAELGVEKYEPVIPPALAGEVYGLTPHERVHFDIENIKAFPSIFVEGEEVVFTEKMHGTFMMAVGLPSRLARETSDGHAPGDRFGVSSKGLMHKQLGIKHSENNINNTYIRAARENGLVEALPALAETFDQPVFVLGEVAGPGVQDLTYGQVAGKPILRAFAIVIGTRFVNDAELEHLSGLLGLARTPVLYRGPFSARVLAEHTDGKETVSGQELHIREGVVVTPVIERRHDDIGRVILKSVSEAYLLRKNGTEFN